MPISDYQPVIGLEVHAQLLTRTKIFCGCSTAFGGLPNDHTCPVCLGLPGALPVLNRQVVELTLRTGLALGCAIQKASVWSRKNYFYPDLPKGYQISQFELPICLGGGVEFEAGGATQRVGLTRIHMEEDAGKSTHDDTGGPSLVDYNRACVPLMEIVSEPELRSSEEASEYLKALRDVLVYLGVNDGNLEEGSLRCDANVSVMRRGETRFGQRCEIKNLNSFRFVRQAIEVELARQVELLERGGAVTQETRLYDPDRNETRPMRSKEDAHDYRYFPEPDLLPLLIEPEAIERARAALPELPRAKVQRYTGQLGLSAYDAGVLAADRQVAEFFDACLARYPDAKKLANWFMGELFRALKEREQRVADLGARLTPEAFAELLSLVDQTVITHSVAKEVFAEMLQAGERPGSIVERKGLRPVSDVGAIEALVEAAIARSPSEAAKYRAGKANLLGFFVGQVMRELKGKGDPAVVNALVKKKLG